MKALQMKCHPDRSVAEWRDLLYLRLRSIHFLPQQLARYRDPQRHRDGLVKFSLELLSAGKELAVDVTRGQVEH
jgi:hypothetical protein